jgi:hypothetical protein
MKHLISYAEQMQLEGIELIFGIKAKKHTAKYVLSKEWNRIK